jgi:predicted deacetylase
MDGCSAALRRGTARVLNAVISIHDVCPERLSAVQQILAMLEKQHVPPATLLIIPGKEWDKAGIATLRTLGERGHPLAGHGWHHHAERMRNLWGRLYSRVLSRNVAEHLALDQGACSDLVARSYKWFEQNDLPAPQIYVPPAWAKGPLGNRQLEALPYRYYEDLWGVYDVVTRCFHRLPVAGFEADSGFRRHFLGSWNRLQRWLAEHLHRPLRIAIHPDDLSLGLKTQLPALIGAVDNFLNYPEAVQRAGYNQN